MAIQIRELKQIQCRMYGDSQAKSNSLVTGISRKPMKCLFFF